MQRKKNPVFSLTPQMRKAIQLSIEGVSIPKIAADPDINVSAMTVRRWFDKPEVLEEYRDMLRKQTLAEVAQAHRNLKKDLDTKDDNQAYLRQNATFFAINKYESGLLGENDGSCVITFVNGTPEVGMPDAADDDE